MTPTFDTLLVSMSEGIGHLQLHRPKALNALNAQLIGELGDAVAFLAQQDLRALVVSGAGGRAFAAGADIKEMVDYSPAQAREMAERGQAVLNQLAAFPAPTIAAVQGFALGGGCELAMCCDIILAHTSAVFGQPEVKIGVIPGFGGTQRLVRRVGTQRALELTLTGRNVKASEAVAIGLALQQVEGDVVEAAFQLAQAMAANAPLAVQRAKIAIHSADTLLAPGLAGEARLFADCFRDTDQSEGMRAFIDRRPPRYNGR